MVIDDQLPDRLASRLSNQDLAIFLFHGVIRRQRNRIRNYTGKHIEMDLFACCIRQLAKSGYALSMDQVLEYCQSGEALPPRAFAITFDDGFENNLSVAAPILAEFNIPLIIYVTTGFVEENGMSWIDRIELAVEEVPHQTLAVSWAKDPFSLTDDESRIRFLKAVRHYVKNEPTCDCNIFADELCARLGKPGKLSSNDPLDLKMTWEQLRAANEQRLISIGGHSHTHAILSFLSSKRLKFEIETSLDLLRRRADISPHHYSYPEGLQHCYSTMVINELKRCGVRCCPTAIDGLNGRGSNPFHLRRILVDKT